MIRIGICDDIVEDIRKQKAMIEGIAKRHGINVDICVYEEGEELLQDIQMYGHMDILFLDIEMEGKNGIETARIIRETDYQTILIFISAYDKYCKKLIEVQPFAFLDKPVSESDLEDVFEKALRIRSAENERFLFSFNKHRYSISLHKILYFESIGRKILIHGLEEDYEFYGKLNEVEKRICICKIIFARVQISYYVNLNHIKGWDYDRIIMDNGTEIPVSKRYRKTMSQYYMEMLKRD